MEYAFVYNSGGHDVFRRSTVPIMFCDFRRVELRRYAKGATSDSNSQETDEMPKFVIERELPGAGKLSKDQLQGISQTSCGVLRNLGPQIQWVRSYVTDDKIYCVYIAPDAEMIREHARQGGFPANKVSEVKTTIDPTTSEPATS